MKSWEKPLRRHVTGIVLGIEPRSYAMTLRELVLEQIHHLKTAQIPYTLTFEPDVGSRLDEHFGGDIPRRWDNK